MDPEGPLVTYQSPKVTGSTNDKFTIVISAPEIPNFITKKAFPDYFELYIN